MPADKIPHSLKFGGYKDVRSNIENTYAVSENAGYIIVYVACYTNYQTVCIGGKNAKMLIVGVLVSLFLRFFKVYLKWKSMYFDLFTSPQGLRCIHPSASCDWGNSQVYVTFSKLLFFKSP